MSNQAPTGPNQPNQQQQNALTQAELDAIEAGKKMYALLEEKAKLLQEINASAGAYADHLIKIGKLQDNINHITKEIADATELLNNQNLTDEERKATEELIKVMEKRLELLKKTKEMYVEVAKEANKTALATQAIFNGISKLPQAVSKLYGALKGTGVFEMDKAIKNAGLEMGIVGKNSVGFHQNITNAAQGVGKLGRSTIDLGVGIEDLAKMQAAYSSELGTSVQLGDEGLNAVAEMAKGTVLGTDGAAQMAGEFSKIGKSAESTRDFVEQTMHDASKMGINAGKVLKSIQANIKMLNKYSFKDGAKGLASMAAMAAKMGTSMEMVSGMQEKLFDIEGAVDMSAQLQVMGGEWSKLADPFKLMHMARNDTEALYASVVNATKGAAEFNKETGDFKIPALELHRLRKVAEQTGLSFDDLAASAISAAKYDKIDSQMSVKVDDKELQEFLSNTAEFDKEGNAMIQVGADKKLLSTLKDADIKLLQKAKDEKADLAKRAKEAQTFDDKLTNLNNLFKTALIPVVNALNETLAPFIDGLIKDKSFTKSLADLGRIAGEIVKTAVYLSKPILDLITLMGPKGTLAALVTGKIFFGVAKWIGNGMALAKGFNMVARAGGGGGASASGGGKGGGKGGMVKGLVGGGIAALGGMALDHGREQMDDPDSKGGKWMGVGSSALKYGGMGAMIGSVIPVIGTAAGAIIGGIAGTVKGYFDEFGEKTSNGINDGVISAPIHDGFISKTSNMFPQGTNIGRPINDGRISGTRRGSSEKASTTQISSPAVGSGINDGVISGRKKVEGTGSSTQTTIIEKGINDGLVPKQPFGPKREKSEKKNQIIGKGMNDGAIPGIPKDIGKGLGADFTKNRGIIQSGKITPIDNKDDLLAMKPHGPVDKAMKQTAGGDMRITFGKIEFGGKIEVSAPGSSKSVDISEGLLKDADFVREITRMVHVETTKAVNGGKISGNPVN